MNPGWNEIAFGRLVSSERNVDFFTAIVVDYSIEGDGLYAGVVWPVVASRSSSWVPNPPTGLSLRSLSKGHALWVRLIGRRYVNIPSATL